MTSEQSRLAAVQRLGMLDTPPDAQLDGVVELAARLFATSTALVSLVAGDRQWFKARIGIELTETAREGAFCDQTIQQSGVLLVEDAAADPRFRDSPFVLGAPHIRFYAGAPLVTDDGAAVGALCVFDSVPGTANAYQLAMLVALADQVAAHLQRRPRAPQVVPPSRPASALPDEAVAVHVRRFLDRGSTGYWETTREGTIVRVNAAAGRMLGVAPADLLGRPVQELAHPDDPMGVVAAAVDLGAGVDSAYEVTRVYKHRTGRPVPVTCTISHLPGSADRPASTATFLTDLSPSVTAMGLRLSAERDRERVLAAATDAYIALDSHGVVREWNAAAERIFGYPAQEAIGQDLAGLIVPAEHRAAHAGGIRRLAAGGEPHLLGRSTEIQAVHRDGRILQVELTPWRVTDDSGRVGYFAFCRDIGERVAARAALLEANEGLRRGRAQLRAAFEASSSADAVIDGTGLLLDVNPQMCRFLDRTRDELLQRRWTDFVYQPDLSAAESVRRRAEVGGVDRTELRFSSGDGQVVWGLASVASMQDGQPGARAVLRIDSLQAYKDLEDALARQSTHDVTTGLPNRGLFLERVRQALVTSDATAPVAALVLRVDGLRELIEAGGFHAGDLAMEALAGRLTATTPQDVTLAHLQPGLFAAVVPKGSGDAARLAARYLTAMGPPIAGLVTAAPLRGSVGVSTAWCPAGEEVLCTGRLVQEAEEAARLAAADGGDAVVFAAPEMREAQQRQQQLEAVVQQALEHRTVGIAYQPVFDLSTGQIVGAEALLRLTDAAGSPVSALEVVTAAEASGQVVELGRQVLQLAAAQAGHWLREHGVLVPVAVNVSAVQLRRRTFTADVLGSLEAAGVPPAALTLELTESVLLTSGSVGMEQLLALRDLGVHLAIDDFGTGYASLTYLRDLPATTLKVDRSFVDGIPDDRGAMAIVRGVIDLAASFGMACIAEGVETEAQREYLAERGILGQGYLLARPADAATTSRLIVQHGVKPAPSGGPGERSLTPARRAVEADRERAPQDREAGAHADERTHPGQDRSNAATVRGSGSPERGQDEHDRSTSSADRRRGPHEGGPAGYDRTSAPTHRGGIGPDRDEPSIDPLSGAQVRGAGLVQLEREAARALRSGASLVVALVEVDGLETVNDLAGRAAGDEVVRDVAQALARGLRSYDLLMRYGGDEFLCAVPGLSLGNMELRLEAALRRLSDLPNAPAFTAGLAEQRPQETVPELIARAKADLQARRQRRARSGSQLTGLGRGASPGVQRPR